MRKRYIQLQYEIKGQKIEFEFDRSGDINSLKVNGVDRSDDGDAIDAALASVAEAGHSIRADISVAFDQEREASAVDYRDDPFRQAKAQAELRMLRELVFV